MKCDKQQQAQVVADLYAGRGSPSWNDWNSTSGGQGYWLLSTATLLVVIGIVIITSKTRVPGAVSIH
jgi:hypothetical protein